MTIAEHLRKTGLFENEIKGYLYLLEQGLSTPPQIAKGTKIARPNVYGLLRSLKDKGFVSEQTKGKRTAYLAADPSAFVYVLEGRIREMKEILPDLRAMYTTQANKPVVKFFEGAEQVKEIFHEMLEAEEVFGIASTKKLYDALGWDFFEDYIKQMRDRNIILHDILTLDSVNTSAITPTEILKGRYDSRSLSTYADGLPVDILIWNDKVALISTEQPVFGTLIKNQAMASVMRVMFDLSWKQLSTN